MQELLELIFGVKNDKKGIVGRAIWRLIHIVSGIIISFYIAKSLNYQYTSIEVSVTAIIHYFASYQILIPLYVTLLSFTTIYLIDKLTIAIILLILKVIINNRIRKFGKEKIIQSDSINVRVPLTIFKNLLRVLRYLSKLFESIGQPLIGLTWIYICIIKTEFPNLYNIVFLVLLLLFLFLIQLIRAAIKGSRNWLKKLKPSTINP